MPTRERWIVYPLLFLALGLAVRDKIIPPTQFRAVAVTTDQLRARRIICDGVAECRAMIVKGPHNSPMAEIVASPDNSNGVVAIFSAASKSPLIQLQATDAGGIVVLLGRQGKGIVIDSTGHIIPLIDSGENPKDTGDHPKGDNNKKGG